MGVLHVATCWFPEFLAYKMVGFVSLHTSKAFSVPNVVMQGSKMADSKNSGHFGSFFSLFAHSLATRGRAIVTRPSEMDFPGPV